MLIKTRSAMAVSLHSKHIVTFVVVAVAALLMEVEGEKRQARVQGRRHKRGNDMCSSNSVAEYKLTFYGAWSKEAFPKMYPTHRPQAQWSQLVGRTHDKSHQMWSEGNTSSPALKKMAEEGDSLLYDIQVQGYDGVFDTFHCEPIGGGEGKTSAVILADGAHSKVSFVVKMVPSPDWFVGVDGLDLCQDGRWRQKLSVNLRPLDAGTDQGFTFTSPNWPSVPFDPVRRITASFPSHPASPFYYPEHKKLPRIAHAEVQLVAQYVRKGAVSPHKPSGEANAIVFGDDTPSTAANSRSSDRLMADTASAGRQNLPASLSAGSDVASKTADDPNSPRVSQGHRVQAARVFTGDTTPFSGPTENAASSSHTEGQGPTRQESLTLQKGTAGLSEHERQSAEVKQFRPDMGERPEPADNQEVGQVSVSVRMPVGSMDADPHGSPRHQIESRLASVQIEEQKELGIAQDKDFAEPATELNSDRVYTSQTFREAGTSAPRQSDVTDRSETGHRKIPPSSFRTTPHPEAEAPAASSNLKTDANVPDDIVSMSENRLTPEVEASSPKWVTPAPRPGVAARSPQQVHDPESSLDDKLDDLANSPRVREHDDKADLREVKGPAEPRTSQSRDTFRQPQFAEISADDPYRTEEPVDCRVTEWGEWGPCSMTCGFGVRMRHRDIIAHSRNGGYSCPPLEQEVLCGSMRSCQWKHFSFLSQKNSKSTRTRRQRRDINTQHN